MRCSVVLSVLVALAALLRVAPTHAQRRTDREAAATATHDDAPAPAAPAVVTTATTRAALDDAAARQHFEAGRLYFQEAQYDDAAREFAEAYRLSERPALLINVSRSQENAGHLSLSLETLRQWERVAPADDENRPAMTERAQRIEAAIRRGGDANARDDTGLTSAQTIGVIVLGSGAVAGIGALITGLMASSIHADLEAGCDSTGGCPPDRVDDIQRGETTALVSTVLLGVALAAGATGLVLLLMGGRDDDESNDVARASTPRVRLAAGPGQLGAGITWTF